VQLPPCNVAKLAWSLQRGQVAMFRVLTTTIIRSTQNCNYSLQYRSYFFVQLPPSNVAKLAWPLQRGQVAMFRVLTTTIIRSTQNCNYSLRYWSYFCAAKSFFVVVLLCIQVFFFSVRFLNQNPFWTLRFAMCYMYLTYFKSSYKGNRPSICIRSLTVVFVCLLAKHGFSRTSDTECDVSDCHT